MARTATRAELRARVRFEGDFESFTDRHPDADIDTVLDQSAAALYERLAHMDEDYFLSSTTIATVDGTKDYSLPADFWMLRGVDALVDSTQNSLDPFMFQERNTYESTDGFGFGAGFPTHYRVLGSTLRLMPTPRGVYTVTVWYIPAPPKFSSDSDTFDGLSGLEDYVVHDTVARLLVRDERDPGYHVQERERLFERVVSSATSRNQDAPKEIVRARDRGLRRYRKWSWWPL